MINRFFLDLIKLEKWFFYLLIFFLPWQTRIILKSFSEPFNEWNSISFYLTDLIFLAVIFLWFWRIVRFRSQTSKKEEIALLAFLAIGALSLIKAQNFWLGFYKEIKLIEMAVLFLYMKSIFFGNNAPHPPLYKRGGAPSLFQREGWGELNYIVKTFVASGLLQALIAIGQFIRQKSFGLSFLDESPISSALAGVAKIVVDGEKMVRSYGLTPHPNILAVFLLIAIFCALYLFTEKNKNLQWRPAVGYTAVLAILTFAFFLTFSRTVIIAGLIAIFVWLIYLLFSNKSRLPSSDEEGSGEVLNLNTEHHPTSFLFSTEGRRKSGLYNSRWYILNTLAVFTATCLLVIISFWPFLSARFDVGTSLADQSLNLRVFYNKVALQFISQNPILGVGIGNFVPAFQASQSLSESWVYQPAHNIYLLIASEIGILGLLAFLCFLFFVIKFGFKNAQGGLLISGLPFLIIGLLIAGAFDHFFWTLQQGQLMLWIMLGILAAYAASPRSSTG